MLQRIPCAIVEFFKNLTLLCRCCREFLIQLPSSSRNAERDICRSQSSDRNPENAVTSADLKQAMQVIHLIPLLRRRFLYSKASVFLATGCPVVVSSWSTPQVLVNCMDLYRLLYLNLFVSINTFQYFCPFLIQFIISSVMCCFVPILSVKYFMWILF